MECYYHPDRESANRCAICGKSICTECGLEIAGKIYCKDCLEKIVGIGLTNSTPEPVKQETPENRIEMANLTKNQEVQFSNPASHKIASDSPYNIKDNISYEGGIESGYDDQYQPVGSLTQAIEANQKTPEPKEEDFSFPPREPVQQARNEYDFPKSEPTITQPPKQEYIYPDHSYDPAQPAPRNSLEDKYERYLDDLYFDEEEIPLNEQLARDEAKYGSLTRNEYVPKPFNEPAPVPSDEEDLENRIRAELARRENEKKNPKSIHNIDYKDEKEPIGAVDILLTVILIIIILIVIYYIIYVFALSSAYPTFLDAILGLRNPQNIISTLFG